MTRRTMLCVPAALLLCAASVSVAGQGQPASPAPSATVTDPDKAARGLLAAECTHCHELDVLDARPHARAEWPGILDQMIANGAGISAEEKALLAEYLGRAHSPAG